MVVDVHRREFALRDDARAGVQRERALHRSAGPSLGDDLENACIGQPSDVAIEGRGGDVVELGCRARSS